MAKHDSRTVSVASCYDPTEAMMIRAVLKARGIEAVIPGADSATMTTGTVGFSSRVLVDEEVAQEAAELIAELRSTSVANEGENEGEEGKDDPEGGESEGSSADDVVLAGESRRRSLGSLWLSMSVTFGTGHLLQRAYGRALLLAGLEVLGIRYVVAGQRLGWLMIVGAITLDAIGGMVVAHRRHAGVRRSPLPNAKLLPRDQ